MPSPRTKNGPQSKPLSEVARHLVLPEGIVTTGWPSVRDKCKLLGIAFDPWQDGAGRAILAKRKSGKYAAGVGGVRCHWRGGVCGASGRHGIQRQLVVSHQPHGVWFVGGGRRRVVAKKRGRFEPALAPGFARRMAAAAAGQV